MKLRDYLDKNKIERAEFAALIDRHPSLLSHWEAGRRRPDWTSLDRIKEATDGKVTARDFE